MRQLLTVAVLPLLLCAVTSCTSLGFIKTKPRDNGGVFLLLAVKADANNSTQAVSRTMNILEGRCDRLGIYCKAERKDDDGANQIMLHISGAKDTERVKAVLLARGMELRPVVSPANPAPIQTYRTRAEAEAAAGATNDVMPFIEDGKADGFLVVEHAPVVTGDDVREAIPLDIRSSGRRDTTYQIDFRLRTDGAERFGRWTSTNVGRYIAIVLNGQVRTAPFIRSQINDSGVINGNFDKQQAEDIALVLMSGNLPAPVELMQEGTYKP